MSLLLLTIDFDPKAIKQTNSVAKTIIPKPSSRYTLQEILLSIQQKILEVGI